ncbi:hypothetical protein LN042_32525 [Kitasatospora sp. RB6PN24]|uniref:hypothetical protein n=1 Tax=Kitasatospora humi TaxID=2893891 RepID=UPI001E33AF91|nr:hypothetical protein [Kitasatospora humi]MCC9311738.1 hypothetical protein [Kitasatospora humi]
MDHRNTVTALAGLALSATVTVTGCAVEHPGPLVNMGSATPTPSSPGSSAPGPGALVERGSMALPPSPGSAAGSAPAGSAAVGPASAGSARATAAAPASAPSAPHPRPRLPQSGRATRPEPSPGLHPPGQPEAPPAPTAGGTGLCALGEQYGQLTPNSDQAQLCRGIYGG